MGHLKHAAVKGINEAAVRAGLIAWDNEKSAAVACARVAKRLSGPEQIQSMTPKTAGLIFVEIRKEHAAAVKRGMKIASVQSSVKTASARDIRAVQEHAARFCVGVKLAESDGSLTNNEPNTPESAGTTNAVANLDNQNRAPGAYLVGVGQSDMPTGGVDGKEMPHPMQQQRGGDPDNSVVAQSKVSADLRRRGITVQKLAQAVKSGNAEQQKHARFLLGELQKEAQQAKNNRVQSSINAVFGKKADDDLSDILGGDPAMGAGGGGDVTPDDIAQALADADIDPADVSPDDVLMALQMPAPDGGSDGGSDGGGSSGDQDDTSSDDKKKDPPKDDDEKDAALFASLRKIAEGGSLTNSPANTPESAAGTNAVAGLDNKNRKPDEYLTGQGGASAVGSNGEGQQYDVQGAPKAPEVNPSNTVTDETKSAEARAHMEYLRKVAKDWGTKLPAAMPEKTKVAHIKALASLDPTKRSGYVASLTKKR